MGRRGSVAKEDRRKAAEARAVERAKRSPQQQLKHLDDTFGVGVGAAKERARLQALIVKA
jgi:hypothetical protein